MGWWAGGAVDGLLGGRVGWWLVGRAVAWAVKWLRTAAAQL